MVSELPPGPIDYVTGSLGNGDVLVLCTDGLLDNITLSRLQAIAADDADPTTLLQALADAALERARAQDAVRILTTSRASLWRSEFSAGPAAQPISVRYGSSGCSMRSRNRGWEAALALPRTRR